MKLSAPNPPHIVGQHRVLLRFSWGCQRCRATAVVEMPPTESCLDLDRRIREQHRKISEHCDQLRVENIAQLESLYIAKEGCCSTKPQQGSSHV